MPDYSQRLRLVQFEEPETGWGFVHCSPPDMPAHSARAYYAPEGPMTEENADYARRAFAIKNGIALDDEDPSPTLAWSPGRHPNQGTEFLFQEFIGEGNWPFLGEQSLAAPGGPPSPGVRRLN